MTKAEQEMLKVLKVATEALSCVYDMWAETQFKTDPERIEKIHANVNSHKSRITADVELSIGNGAMIKFFESTDTEDRELFYVHGTTGKSN